MKALVNTFCAGLGALKPVANDRSFFSIMSPYMMESDEKLNNHLKENTDNAKYIEFLDGKNKHLASL